MVKESEEHKGKISYTIFIAENFKNYDFLGCDIM
jgi:hypothetical protein